MVDVDLILHSAYKILLWLTIFFVGACLGSFACCQAWRLRYGEKGRKISEKWSICLHCKKKLQWYHNIPIISWLILRGRCAYCGKKIGTVEILAEIVMGVVFFLMLVTQDWWPMGWETLRGVLVLAALIPMGILFIYDAKWGRLPVVILRLLNILALTYVLCELAEILVGLDFSALENGWVLGEFLLGKVGVSVALLSGIYFLLYKFSEGRLVGGGDWQLCLSIALFLSDPWLALIVLFLANFLGLLIMLPRGKKVIYFGPFLITAFLVVYFLRDYLTAVLVGF